MSFSNTDPRVDAPRLSSDDAPLPHDATNGSSGLPDSPQVPPDGVILLRGDTITAEPVRWLWPGWLARGKLAILAGAPGTGKTTLAINMAATVTRGGLWADGSHCPRGDVLIWSGEDDPADTLVPRLMAAGADLTRVHIVDNVREYGEVRPFDPATDTPGLLRSAGRLPALRFILVDPVVSAVAGDSHKNTEVRRGLQPLVDFASATKAALLGITHFSKAGQGQDPTQRVTGSIAFSAVARVVLVAAKSKDKEGNDQRVLARSKSNLGPDEGGFAYTLESCEPKQGIYSSRVVWGEQLEGSARDLLAEHEGADDAQAARDEVEMFLRERLALGTCPVATIYEEAKAAGISTRTLSRVATSIGVHKRKGGMATGWYWTLRSAEGTRPLAEEAEETHHKTSGIFGTFDGSLSLLVVEGQCAAQSFQALEFESDSSP